MVTKSRKNPIQSRRMSMAQKKMLAGFLFTLPAIIGVIWLFLIPMGKSLFTSFHHVEISLQSKSTEYTFMGFENYRTALARDPTFNQTLVESLVQMLVAQVVLKTAYEVIILPITTIVVNKVDKYERGA